MKKTKIVSAGFSFLAALLSVKVLTGQFKTKVVDGVTVVTNGKNPQPPKGAATKLVLEEIYSAGGGDSVEASLVQPIALDVDKDGNAFVVDFKDSRVRVFDSRGKFLRTFGKKGQGPGELNMPMGILISSRNEVLVEDFVNARLAFFSLDGKFLRHFSTAKTMGLSGIRMNASGLAVARSVGMGEGGKFSMDIKTYDKDFNPKVKLASMDYAISGQPKINPFAAMTLLYELDRNGNIFLAGPKGYEIRTVSPEGKLLRRIARDFDPIPISKADKDKVLKAVSNAASLNIEWPAYYPPYLKFVLADEGRLLVLTFEDAKEKDQGIWDVFDSAGRFVAKVPITKNINLWRDGRIYSFAEDADGYQVLHCFRARWEK